jgi:ATP phosphoribosyltransferase
MLRIALPNKGRLAEQARTLFFDAGLPLATASERALRAAVSGVLEVLFVRAADIPELVADGAADGGITGWDLTRESGRELTSRLDLGFGDCSLVVAVKDDSPIRAIADIPPGARVATSFPRIANAFFQCAALPVDVVPVGGAAEIAPHLGIADIIVDLTSSGSTLRTNGMRPVGTIMHSSARFVTPPSGDAASHEALTDLVATLESVVAARRNRYVMANVPRESLAAIRDVLPGLRGPTVVDVLNGGAHVAVHAVVPAALVSRTIADLRAIGGEGILVTRIERLLP